MNGSITELLDKMRSANQYAELWLTRDSFNTLARDAKVAVRETDIMPTLSFYNKDGEIELVFQTGQILRGPEECVTIQIVEINSCDGKQILFPFTETRIDPTII